MDHIKRKLSANPLLAVFLTIFIDLVGVGILIPVFPLLVTPGSPDSILPAGWTVKEGFILLGWLSASYPLALFVAAPILGQLADRYGRKPVLALSISGTALGYALFAVGLFTKNIPLLFASRILDGISGGNISVAQAVIADISTPKNRARNFGLVGMAFGLGFILGPYIGGKLADPNVVSWFSATTPFIFTTILSILNVAMVIFFLPETLKVKIHDKLDPIKAFHNIALAFSRPGLRSIMPTSFLFSAGFTFFTTFFAITLYQKYGFSQGNIGDYFAYIGLWIAIVQGVITGFLAKIFKDYQILRYSVFITAAALAAYYFIPDGSYKWLFVVAPFVALGNGLTMAFTSSLISRITPRALQGQALGISASVMALAQSIPAIISGDAATISDTLPIAIGCGTVALGGILFWILFRPHRDDKNAAVSGAEKSPA